MSATLWARGDTAADALALAADLASLGVRPGDRVLLQSDNSPTYPLAFLALCHLDASIVLADAQLVPEQTWRLGLAAGVRWLVGDRAAPDGVTGFDLGAWRPRTGDRGALSLERWEQRTDALLMWSSGTTGEPKAVVKSGGAVLSNCRLCAQVMGYRRDDLLAPLLPFSHQYGISMLLIWWLTGCGLLVAPYRRLGPALAAAAEAGATVVDGAPVLYEGLLELAVAKPSLLDGLRRVRMWCVGGAPLARPLAHRFRAVVGHDLLDGYGMTELGNIALAVPGRAVGCGPPLPGVELRVLGEDGAALPPGGVGEIAVRTPGRMEGYLQPDGSLSPTPIWFRTGDLGCVDAEGNVYVHGRWRAVHRMGHTLYPEQLERRAEECGAPVKVVPLEDPQRGVSLVFFVQDAHGDEATWRRRFRRQLAPFERPNAVVVLPSFPVNRNGKVDLVALQATVPQRLRT